MSEQPEPIGGIFIPANALTPDEMHAFLTAYATSPAVLASVVHMYEVMARPGVTFTEEQKQQIQAVVEAGQQADAQRVILEQLRADFGD